jgi:ribosome-associated toxin RatA of RatAB toxin-antitoxin module
MSKVSERDATLARKHPQVDPSLLEGVEVKTDKLEGRQRRICASIKLPYSIEQAWQVLTDYDALAEFIPNLVKSQRIEHPEGGIRLEQIGTQQVLLLDFSARVVLDMEEDFPHNIRFSMVEGDFKAFSGSWHLQQWPYPDGTETHLTYTVLVLPKRTMPVFAVEQRICCDLPLNLVSIHQRLGERFDQVETAKAE